MNILKRCCSSLGFWLCLLGLPLFLLRTSGWHDWGGDFALYFTHAQNLLGPRAYADTGYLFDPSVHCFSPAAYPPGFPLLLVPVVAIFGAAIQPVQLLLSACLLIWGLLLFALLGPRVGRREAFLFVLLLWYNPWTLVFKGQILSDLPFALYLTLCWACVQSPRPRVQWGIFVFLPWLVLTRTAGWAVPAGLIATLLLRPLAARNLVSLEAPPLLQSPRRAIASIALAVLAAVCWQSWVEIPRDNSYVADIKVSAIPAVALAGLDYYLNVAWEFFPRVRSFDTPRVVLGSFCLTFILVGFVSRLRRLAWWDFMMLASLVLLLLWPCRQGFRFVLPLLPFFFLYLHAGLRQLPGAPWVLRAVLVAMLLLSALAFPPAPPVDKGPTSPQALDMFQAVRQHVPTGERVDFFKPRVMALYGERPSRYLQLRRIGDPTYGQPYAVVTVGPPPDTLGHSVWSNERFHLVLLP